MLASHRTPATLLMTAGGFLIFISVTMIFNFGRNFPHAMAVVVWIMLVTGLSLFLIGSCVYARGMGYPFWLGIFSLTVVGLLILMLLQDHHSEDDFDD